MSDAIKHECGISLIRLLKPLEFYKKKYGTAFYGVNKMYLMMEKQHNRGQDGAGFASIKLDMNPGERYMSRVRSVQQQPIQEILALLPKLGKVQQRDTSTTVLQKLIALSDHDILSSMKKRPFLILDLIMPSLIHKLEKAIG